MTAFYNENDPKAAATLRELIKRGVIAPGVVDERSIIDIRPSELTAYTQCHFFAGYGVWSYSLRLADWPDNRRVWTGSCPCQPFSAAGKGDGFNDERHLWPAWDWLISHGKPEGVPIFGEQVASGDGLAWLDLVQADLEAKGNAVSTIDTCAAGFGAPIIRQRLYIMASTECAGLEGYAGDGNYGNQPGRNGAEQAGSTPPESPVGSLDSTESIGQSIGERGNESGQESKALCGRQEQGSGWTNTPYASEFVRGRPTNGFWGDADWLFCRDVKWRPVEPGTFPLADGAAERVGRLRGYGNAINAYQAAAFIKATM